MAVFYVSDRSLEEKVSRDVKFSTFFCIHELRLTDGPISADSNEMSIFLKLGSVIIVKYMNVIDFSPILSVTPELRLCHSRCNSDGSSGCI